MTEWALEEIGDAEAWRARRVTDRMETKLNILRDWIIEEKKKKGVMGEHQNNQVTSPFYRDAGL